MDGHKQQNALDLFLQYNNLKNMLNIFTGFGREIDEKEDPRYKSTFAKKPSEFGKAGFNKYGDFLGFGKQAEDKPNFGGYQSPFTTLKKEGFSYNGNQLTSQEQRDRMAGKFDQFNDMPQTSIPKIGQQNQPKPGQPRPTPYPSIINSYKRI